MIFLRQIVFAEKVGKVAGETVVWNVDYDAHKASHTKHYDYMVNLAWWIMTHDTTMAMVKYS